MDVQQLAATSRAFAAILADGSVVAWGNPSLGGDVSNVAERLKLGAGLREVGLKFKVLSFFPTCQVRVVGFYVSCPPPSSLILLPRPPPRRTSSASS